MFDFACYIFATVTFSEYLINKKIDELSFKDSDHDRYVELKDLFEQIHPNSFTSQKLFLINEIRRSNPLKTADIKAVAKNANADGSKKAKPVIQRPRPVTKPGKPVMKRPKMK